MAATKQVRRSVTLPTRSAEQVERIGKKRRLSDHRVLVELVELGLEAQKEKEKDSSLWRSVFEPRPIQNRSSSLAMRWGVSSSGSDAADRELVPPPRRAPGPHGRVQA